MAETSPLSSNSPSRAPGGGSLFLQQLQFLQAFDLEQVGDVDKRGPLSVSDVRYVATAFSKLCWATITSAKPTSAGTLMCRSYVPRYVPDRIRRTCLRLRADQIAVRLEAATPRPGGCGVHFDAAAMRRPHQSTFRGQDISLVLVENRQGMPICVL